MISAISTPRAECVCSSVVPCSHGLSNGSCPICWGPVQPFTRHYWSSGLAACDPLSTHWPRRAWCFVMAAAELQRRRSCASACAGSTPASVPAQHWFAEHLCQRLLHRGHDPPRRGTVRHDAVFFARQVCTVVHSTMVGCIVSIDAVRSSRASKRVPLPEQVARTGTLSSWHRCQLPCMPYRGLLWQ